MVLQILLHGVTSLQDATSYEKWISLTVFRRVEITKKGESYKMIIKNLVEEDAGEYMCKVGDRPTKCQVTVEECKFSLRKCQPNVRSLSKNVSFI